jgi:hypothetical protein
MKINQEIKENLMQKREAQKCERQNFLKLLKHIKGAICNRQDKNEGMRDVLDHLQIKIDELYVA